MQTSELFSKNKVIIILTCIAIAAISLSVFSYQYYDSTAKQILEIASKDIRSNAKIQANDLSIILENGLDSIITNLQILSSSPAVRNYDNDSLGLFDAVQDSTNELPDYYMWLDREGKLMWISGMNNTTYKDSKGIDLSHNQYFTAPRYTLTPYYSDGTIESLDGITRMHISYPIIEKIEKIEKKTYEEININTNDRIENGENIKLDTKPSTSTGTFKGVVVAAISFDVTNSILKKQASSSSEVARNSIMLLDKKGEILLYSEDDHKTVIGKNILETNLEFMHLEYESLDTPVNTFFRKLVQDPTTESKDFVFDDGKMKSTIVSDPVFADGKHFWTAFVVAPHYLASDVTALFSQQNNISILVIVMIIVVASSMASIILSWNKRLASLVYTRTTELRLKSEELNRANESLTESNKQILSVNQDLSLSNEQLVEANKKLEIQDKMQKEFINIAAHELRTPIMPIVGGLELLEDKLGDSSKENVKEEISMIKRNAERLHKLAEDILLVTSIESGNLRIDLQKTDLGSLVSAITNDIKRKYSNEKNIPIVVERQTLRYNQQQQQQQQQQHPEQNKQNSHNSRDLELFSSREPENLVLCDPEKISQVLFNLLDNAFKFTDKGQIVVSVIRNNHDSASIVCENKEEEQILVSIKDTGKGIDPLIKDRLFQRFATKSVKGTGLGLYLSKKIIEAHGGRIWAKGNGDNTRGTTFTFSLPMTNLKNNPT